MKKLWNYDQPIWVNIVGILLGLIAILAITFGLMCLNAWLIMLVWNVTLPTLFSGVSAITFWKAFGIDFLVWLLFGGISKIILNLIK